MKNEYATEDARQLVHRWFEEVWNQGRADAIEEMFAEDGIAHGLADESGAPLRGTSVFREFHKKFRGAFPDIVVTVEDTVVEGDKVAARCSVRAMHAGDDLGFAATQKPMEITGMTMARVKDGKIVEAWNNFDFMSMFRQLGAL
ncbi:MAG TPA: ester cyclase [Pyrinomonadaceae bacterium]|nr:ester cyclase [Pyrinomonadaceae bacterium]